MKQDKQNQRENIESKDHKSRNYSSYTWILLACILAFAAYVRFRLLSTPLERDEGEYAYMGQLLLQGVPPYEEAFNMKLPGTSFMYAFFMFLFGQTISAIHLGLLLVNSISIVLLFLLTRKWLSSGAGIAASISYTLITINPQLYGFAAHATHFVVLFALGGTLMLEKAFERRSRSLFFMAGVLFGIAFLMKQPGIFFFFFGLAVFLYYRIIRSWLQKDLIRFGSLFTGGFLLPVLAVLAVILSTGTFNRFWFWVIQYGFLYATTVPINEIIDYLGPAMQGIWGSLPAFCILTVIGFVLIINGKCQRRTKVMLFLFGFFSLLALLPGFIFRGHYFILVAPACSIFIGFGFNYFYNVALQHPGWKYIPTLIFVIVIGENILSNQYYYFITPTTEIVRWRYRTNYFQESVPISEFLASHTTPNERIAVFGSEPQIYFYSKRRSASGHIYMYGMMESQPYARKMQEEFIADIERTQPKYIVNFIIPFSWIINPDSDLRILDWGKEYTAKRYKPVGVIDLIGLDNVRYIWGDSVLQYTPVSQNKILVYERIDEKR